MTLAIAHRNERWRHGFCPMTYLWTLYKTQVKMHVDNLNIVERETSQTLWHQRLSHMSEKSSVYIDNE